MFDHKTWDQKRTEELAARGLCRSHKRPLLTGYKTLCDQCKENGKKASRVWYQHLKESVMKMYGGACVCCGEDYIKFLCLDHILPCRGQRDLLGKNLYRKLQLEGLSPDYQVLCWNCNMYKRDKEKCNCPFRKVDGVWTQKN
jgi:hypothetical protein